jgi:tRNA threonylcarbamoyladenosine biosynthesis protein TsaE
MSERAASPAASSLPLEVSSPAETTAFGHKLAAVLFPGAVVALVGPLGAGKTYLVRAIAEGLGITNSRVVTSPTFVLIQEYDARLPVYHFDVYRLRAPRDFVDLGAHEYFEGRGVSLVEWADRVQEYLPAEHLRITTTVTGETTRRLLLEAFGEPYVSVIRHFRSSGFLGEGVNL